jgi:putative heme transporter
MTKPRIPVDEERRDTHHGRQALRYTLGLVVGAGALWLIVSAAGGLGDAIDALRRTTPAWLAPAIAFEAAAYVLAAVRLRRLAGPEADLSPVAATELALVVNGLGLLTPASPAEGIAFEYRELGRRGLPRRRIALTIGFEQWFSTRVFYLVQALNLLLIVATRDFPADAAWPLAAAAVILTLLALTAVAAARPHVAERVAVFLGAFRFWRPRTSPAERRVAGARLRAEAMGVVGPPRERVRLMLLSVASLLADVACLWMLMFAVGIHDGFDIALLAAGAAAAASAVPLLPGGIGAVELAVPALLAWYGAPVAAALSATLLYRAIGTFLPAAAGGISIFTLRVRRPPGPTGTELNPSDDPSPSS